MLTASFTALWQDQSVGPMAGLFSGGFMLFALAFAVVVIIGWWKMFEKAGEPGWAAIIPIFNVIVLLKIAGRPVWWVVLYFIPLVNIVATIIVAIDIAKAFGQSAVFGFFLQLPVRRNRLPDSGLRQLSISEGLPRPWRATA